MGDKLSVAHTTFYKPIVTDFNRYVITSTTQARYSVASAVSLTATFVDNYDSEAAKRGARVNNDGQLLLGLQLAR